jgi:hypothetical protein
VVVVEISCGNKPGKPNQLIPSAMEGSVPVAEQDLNPPDAETATYGEGHEGKK